MQIINNYTTTVVKLNSKRPNFKADSNSQPRQNPSLFRELESITDEKSVLLFLKKSPEIYTSVDEKGNHVIHYIVRKNFYETLKQMLINPQKARVLLEQKGEGGKTPLAVANSEKVAKLLISKGANPYALDDNFSPAGANPVLPQEFRDKIQKTVDEKLKASGVTPTKAVPAETVTHPPIVDTEPLRTAAAEAEYSKTVETTPISEEKPVQNQPKKSFFSMFTSKPKTAEPAENEVLEPAKEEAKQEAEQAIEPAKEEIKQESEQATVQTEPVQVEKKPKEKKEIVIKGAEAFKRLDTPEVPGLDSVVGLTEIKNALQKCVIEPVTNEEASTTLNENLTTIPNGILLVSPPGNGKTMLVKALGAEASMPVLEATSAADINRLVDIIGKNFDEKKQRAIIYMRGLDNLYTENSQTGEITNELLRTLNDTASRGALVVFSVECPENIPKSILSPGRVDRVFTIKSPDMAARLAFIESYISGKKLLERINVKEIADKTQGFSIAQIKHVIDDSVLNAATELNEFVTTSELLERIKQFSKEQNIPEINEYNKTSMYDTALKRYQPTVYDAKDFESIAGMPATKRSVEEAILRPWQNADRLREAHIQLPAGGVFAGDPGTSKTYMAKALSGSLGIPLYILKMSDIGSSFVHETSKNIGRIIDQLITKFDETGEASILLMDEIDHFQKGQSQHGAEEVNTLLQEVERGRGKILFIGTTNELEVLPDSLTRDGRMGTVIHFEHCDENAAEAIIKNMLSERRGNPEAVEFLNNNEQLKAIAKRCSGMVAASVSAIVNDALSDSIINNTKLEDAFDTAVKTRKKKDIEKMLSQNSRNSGHRLNISEDSTIMYDTFLERYQYTPFDAENFESIVGMPATKGSVEDSIMKPWRHADKLRNANIQLPAGGIFAGDPGTSKTYMAKAIARSLDIPLYVLKMSDVGSALVHETSKNIGRIVDQLITKFDKTGEASVLLMDEIDHFQKGESQHGAEEVNTLLQEVERGRGKILFIGTTNEIESLPDSLTRDGRMGAVIHFEHCDENAAGAILKNILLTKKENPEAERILQDEKLLKSMAKRCSGMVAASVSAVVNDALADSVINDIKLEDALDSAIGIRKKKDIEKMLSQNSNSAGHRLNITEDSTIMYDTRHPRMQMSETEPQKLDDLGGMDEVKSTLRNEIIDIYQPETLALLRENKLPITKGFILHGPPGNGKTTIVKALANEMGLPVYPLNTGNIGSSYIHQLARNAQEVREQLAYKFKMTGERSIVFMDEAQQLVPRTSGSMMAHQHSVEETNFFKDMIMTAQQDGIIYAMATNDLNQIEPAFYENADRLGVCVFVGNPDLQSRLGIIKKLLDDRPITKALNNPESIEMLAQWFDGFSISKISQSILNLVRNSIKTRTPITLENSVEFIRKVR